jgi:hypothetical protein
MAPAERGDVPQRRVLVCSDDSELGELASWWAAQCARDLGVALVRLHGSVAAPEATLSPAHPADLLVLGIDDRHGRVPYAALDLVATAPCLTVLVRLGGGNPKAPVTAAVSGDPSDEAVLAAAVDLAALCHSEVRLLHARPLPLRRSDSSEERWTGRAVLESARRQILRLAPDCTPSIEFVRLQAQEAVCHHCGDGLLVVGARRTPHPGLGLVTRTALYHARSPVAVARASATDLRPEADPLPAPRRHGDVQSHIDRDAASNRPIGHGE